MFFLGKSRSHSPRSTKTTEVYFAEKTAWLPKFPQVPVLPDLWPMGTKRKHFLSTRRIFGRAKVRAGAILPFWGRGSSCEHV